MPKLPSPEFQLIWKNGEYKVTKPGIGDTNVYTKEQMLVYGRQVAEKCANVCEDMKPPGGRMWSVEQSACYEALSDAAKLIRVLVLKYHRTGILEENP